ncbi:MAG: threonine ammonia-lyase IlvA [Bacilli bacterium]
MSVSEQVKQAKTKIEVQDIIIAHQRLKDVVTHTPLQRDDRLSERYECNVWLKREDLQIVRSFKIRGAYNKMSTLTAEQLAGGVVCASAGNHAQGVAFSCRTLKVHGKIFMPQTTPKQKIQQVELHGKDFIEIILVGDTYDASFLEAKRCEAEEGRVFVHPFDDIHTMSGQGTVGMEILNDVDEPVDYLFASFGGGGLLSGVGSYFKCVSPQTQIVACEPLGAPSFEASLKAGQVVTLEQIDKFVDGAAVGRIGDQTFDICRDIVDHTVTVAEGRICTTILQLYNEQAIVAEPAGALPVAALEQMRDQIRGKNVVCILSGGNNDIGRMQEIKERSKIYEGQQHYFIVNFPQRAGALRQFLTDVLGPNDDITRFEYTKKNNRENGPALVGVEVKDRADYEALVSRMTQNGFTYVEVNKEPNLFHLLV